MFKFFKKKKAESPVDFIDIGGYGSSRVKSSSQNSASDMTSDGYVTVPAPSSQSQSNDTDFLGAMASSSASDTSQPSTSSTSMAEDNQIYKILRKISHISDRIELMEKKIDRIERKTGLNFEELS